MAAYRCLILGDGNRNTPFRPAISDVLDLSGTKAFDWTASLPTGLDGRPIDTLCTVEATGNTALIAGNPNIVPI